MGIDIGVGGGVVVAALAAGKGLGDIGLIAGAAKARELHGPWL